MSPKISKELSNHRLEQQTKEQIETAKELIDLVDKYINEKINK